MRMATERQFAGALAVTDTRCQAALKVASVYCVESPREFPAASNHSRRTRTTGLPDAARR
jgi:hypothetical protein